MRVLFVSDVYFPRVNGVSTSIHTFREDLARLGVESTLVAPAYELPGAEPEAGRGAEPHVMRVPSGRVPGDPEDRRMHWHALRRALEALPRGAFDLAHIHTPFIAHYAGVRFARAAGIACLATYHTFFEEYLHHYVPVLPRGLGRLLARGFTRSQCRAVDALVAPSEPMRAVLESYGIATPIHVLPTGLPADRFAQADGARFRALAQLPAERPLLLYVGRLAHEKNIEFLIRGFARLRPDAPQAMLVIAGEGPAHPALLQLVRQLDLSADVRFVGYLDRSQTLLDCYAAASAFVFASRTETQGLVLLEAMAQGAAVVSTAELGTRSILTPAAGALVVPERVEEFAAAVLRVLNDAPLQRELAEKSRRYAREWSSLSMARRLAALYHDLYDRARRARAQPHVVASARASSAGDTEGHL